MRRLGFVLLALSILLGCARLFTGVVYLSDEPTALLVLKHGPATWMERPESPGEQLSQLIVLDSEEPQLSYHWLYRPLMQAAPGLVPGLGGAAAVLLAAFRRRRIRPRS